MTDTAPRTDWPLAPGEHPDLPRLVVEVHEGRPAVAGRKPTSALPPYVRVLWSPIRGLTTSNPDRLRAAAHQLLRAASDLEAEHHQHQEHTGQLDLGRP